MVILEVAAHLPMAASGRGYAKLTLFLKVMTTKFLFFRN